MTIYETLLQAGLPVISAEESGAISMRAMTTEQREAYANIILQYFNPVEYQKITDQKVNIKAFEDEYQNALTTLDQIQGAPTLTNAQAIAAIKYLAKTMKIILKILYRMNK